MSLMDMGFMDMGGMVMFVSMFSMKVLVVFGIICFE